VFTNHLQLRAGFLFVTNSSFLGKDFPFVSRRCQEARCRPPFSSGAHLRLFVTSAAVKQRPQGPLSAAAEAEGLAPRPPRVLLRTGPSGAPRLFPTLGSVAPRSWRAYGLLLFSASCEFL